MYNWGDWYWLADDKRVFSSARQVIVNDQDADYLKFAEATTPTAWPRDTAGNQTEAALQDVLTPFNLFVNVTYYAADARWRRASGGLTVQSLSAVPFTTDPVSRNSINNAWNYATAKGASFTIEWKMSDGSFITMNQTQVIKLSDSASHFVESCFACESDTLDKIAAGTITTHAQVDAAFAAIPNVVP